MFWLDIGEGENLLKPVWLKQALTNPLLGATKMANSMRVDSAGAEGGDALQSVRATQAPIRDGAVHAVRWCYGMVVQWCGCAAVK